MSGQWHVPKPQNPKTPKPHVTGSNYERYCMIVYNISVYKIPDWLHMLFVLQQLGEDQRCVLFVLQRWYKLLFCYESCKHCNWLIILVVWLICFLKNEFLNLIPVMSHVYRFYQFFDLVKLRFQIYAGFFDFRSPATWCNLTLLLESLNSLAILIEDWSFFFFIWISIFIFRAWTWLTLFISLFVCCCYHLKNRRSYVLWSSRLTTKKFCLIRLHLIIELDRQLRIFRSTLFTRRLLSINFSYQLCCIWVIRKHLL